MDANVQHDKENQQFTTEVDGEEAELAYSIPHSGVIDFTHTYVPKEMRSQGIAASLIEAGLKYADENGKKVIASCPAVAKYIRSHEQYQRLLQ